MLSGRTWANIFTHPPEPVSRHPLMEACQWHERAVAGSGCCHLNGTCVNQVARMDRRDMVGGEHEQDIKEKRLTTSSLVPQRGANDFEPLLLA